MVIFQIVNTNQQNTKQFLASSEADEFKFWSDGKQVQVYRIQ